MRAALAEELGGIERVELGELADPVPAAGQALVRVGGAGVGPWDVGFLSGSFPGLALVWTCCSTAPAGRPATRPSARSATAAGQSPSSCKARPPAGTRHLWRAIRSAR